VHALTLADQRLRSQILVDSKPQDEETWKGCRILLEAFLLVSVRRCYDSRHHLRNHSQRTVNRENAWPELEIPDDAKNGIRELGRQAESQHKEKTDSDYLQAVQDTIRVRNQTHLSSVICSRFPTNVSYLFSAEVACHPHRRLVQAWCEEEIRVGSALPRVGSNDL
jgi:hypothetical protein